MKQDGLYAESKYFDAKRKNVIQNNIIIKDFENVVLANITTKVVADSDVNLYSDEVPANLDVYIYEGEQLAYKSGFRNGKK